MTDGPGTAQQLAHAAQNSTKVAQNPQCFNLPSTKKENTPETQNQQKMPQCAHGMSVSAIMGLAQYLAQNSTKVAQNSGGVFPLKAFGGKPT